MIYKWRQQFDTKQSKAFKRTAAGEDSEHHQLTVSELIKENNRLQKELKLAAMENETIKKLKLTSGTKRIKVQVYCTATNFLPY